MYSTSIQLDWRMTRRALITGASHPDDASPATHPPDPVDVVPHPGRPIHPNERLTGYPAGFAVKKSPIPPRGRPIVSGLRWPRQMPLVLLQSGLRPAYAGFVELAAASRKDHGSKSNHE